MPWAPENDYREDRSGNGAENKRDVTAAEIIGE